MNGAAVAVAEKEKQRRPLEEVLIQSTYVVDSDAAMFTDRGPRRRTITECCLKLLVESVLYKVRTVMQLQ